MKLDKETGENVRLRQKLTSAGDAVKSLFGVADEASLLGDSPIAGGYQAYYRWAAIVALLGSGLALWLHQRVRGRQADH